MDVSGEPPQTAPQHTPLEPLPTRKGTNFTDFQLPHLLDRVALVDVVSERLGDRGAAETAVDAVLDVLGQAQSKPGGGKVASRRPATGAAGTAKRAAPKKGRTMAAAKQAGGATAKKSAAVKNGAAAKKTAKAQAAKKSAAKQVGSATAKKPAAVKKSAAAAKKAATKKAVAKKTVNRASKKAMGDSARAKAD